MKFIYLLISIFIMLTTIIILDIKHYDYNKKKKSIKEIANKVEYLRPAFSFESKEYKGFVYDK